jgi:hypothetical protein
VLFSSVDQTRLAPKSSRRRLARAWARIGAGELSCRVADEGITEVARRLATTTAFVRGAMSGTFRLSPVRVLALRDGIDLEPFLDAWFQARRAEPPHA